MEGQERQSIGEHVRITSVEDSCLMQNPPALFGSLVMKPRNDGLSITGSFRNKSRHTDCARRSWQRTSYNRVSFTSLAAIPCWSRPFLTVNGTLTTGPIPTTGTQKTKL